MTNRTLNDILLEVETIQLIDLTAKEADAVRKELLDLWQETVDLYERIGDLRFKLDAIQGIIDA